MFVFIKEVLSYFGMFIPWIKKWIYSERKFKNDVLIHVGKTYPVQFTLCTDIPTCELWIDIINLSQFLDIVITGINVSYLSINSNGMYAVLTGKDKILRETICKKSVGQLFVKFELSEKHIEIINRIKRFCNLEATLQVQIFVETELYKLTIAENFQNIPCKLSLRQYPVKEQ